SVEVQAVALHAAAAEEGTPEQVVGAGRDDHAARRRPGGRRDELPEPPTGREHREPLPAARHRPHLLRLPAGDELPLNAPEQPLSIGWTNRKRVIPHRVLHSLGTSRVGGYSTGVTRTIGSRQCRGASGISPSGAAYRTA